MKWRVVEGRCGGCDRDNLTFLVLVLVSIVFLRLSAFGGKGGP